MSTSFFLQPVGPKDSPAPPPETSTSAPSSPSSASGPGPMSQVGLLLPMVLMIVVMFLISSRRQKKENEQRAKLNKGDRVVSTAGLVGELVERDERFAKVKLAPGMPPVQMLLSSLSPLDDGAAKKEAAPTDAKLATDKK